MTTTLPEPAGFPNCPRCAFAVTGAARLCSQCAGRTLQPVAVSHCPVCSQTVAPGQACSNRLCSDPVDQRGFSRVDAVAMYSGALREKIHSLKYGGRRGWAMIFGRLLVGWMETHPGQMLGIDYVIGNPTHAGRRPIQHIEAIMDAAYTEDVIHAFPFTPPGRPLLVKTSETERSATQPGGETQGSTRPRGVAALERGSGCDPGSADPARRRRVHQRLPAPVRRPAPAGIGSQRGPRPRTGPRPLERLSRSAGSDPGPRPKTRGDPHGQRRDPGSRSRSSGVRLQL